MVLDPAINLIKISTIYYKSFNITRKEKENIRFLPRELTIIVLYYLILYIPLYKFIRREFLEEKTISPLLLEYNNKELNSSSISSLLFSISQEVYRDGITLRPYRHFINWILNEKFKTLDLNIDSSDDNIKETINRQANRSIKVGELNYSRTINLGLLTKTKYNLTIVLIEKFISFFNLDITFLEFKQSLKNIESIDITIPLSKTVVKEDSILNRSLYNITTKKPNLLETLRIITKDPNSTFRDPKQLEAIEAVLDRLPYITYINKTGSGKSLLFLIPAYLFPNRLYIIILPRLALKNDLLRKALEANINTKIFGDNKDLTNTTLLLVSIESIQDSNLVDLVINKAKDIDITIFIDEVHLIILEKNFRYILKYINTLL